ncbi:isoleucyl-tRNA synthetase [Nakamurella sp. UYEF19]|uniref:isoleucine--tRNA ligase n=1 Tax=Nakamurella sp. UYEF19 TaxID=1756392 RepID=UPI003396F880
MTERTKYPLAGDGDVTARPDFPSAESTTLAYWKSDDTFQASIDQRDAGENGSNEFVFYDGPPFANGLPHYGHLLTGYVKDVVPRYQTMRGRKVERRFGWDTHGLPAELEAERQLGIKGRGEILEMGIEKFNDACRESVMRYANEWQDYVTKQARWVDFENDYKTLDPSYMESVLWAFKTLYDKGYVYEGQRVLPYCWVDETPLSNHELKMDDDVYQQRQDPSVTIWVRLQTGERLMAWTTTPWTLPSNLAMAVGPDLDYVVVEFENERYILAEARLASYAREFGEDIAEHVVDRLKGSELVGRSYEPLFDFLTDVSVFGTEAAFRVIPADHVTTEDGTGVVHMAPAYGEEDQTACEAAGIPTILTVDDRARFTAIVPPYSGMQVFDANPFVIDDLKNNGHLIRRETYEHSYPHCWRCRNPLIYKAVSSWFVEVTKFRDRMVELNQQITWVPEHIKDGQFGKWLANARDWSISRNRFWGSPIPVWKSDDPLYPRVDVYGSIAELEADFGTTVTDLHRPYIDDLTRQNPDDPTGRSTMRRVTEVLDVWFDSGSMPFAQVHYPFENRTWFENHYPGDFIVEYIGQTRGWFYLMHVLATALFDRPAFSTCVSHGIVLGDDGRKMSKSLRNYPDVNEVFARDGSDAMRWFLMASPILRGGNLIVSEAGIREGVRQAVLPLWNAYYFLTLYAGAAGKVGHVRTDSGDVLDRYILAKTSTLVDEITAQMDVYDIAGACASVRNFLEVLTNWYVRRSRQRFWDGDDDAVDTLHTVLETVCRVAAPLLPLTTEQIWRGLTGERSVHLTQWPSLSGANALPADPDLVAAMDEAREIASVALSLRKGAKLRVRQPLAALTVASPASERLQQFGSLLAEEVNVRSVSITPVGDTTSDGRLEQKLTINARVAGPRLGKQVQQVIGASKKETSWVVAEDGSTVVGGVQLLAGEFSLDAAVRSPSADAPETIVTALLRSGGFVSLDTVLDDELIAQGSVNDLLRLVQQARKDAGFQVSDRITLALQVPDDLWTAVDARREQVAAETLATAIGRVPHLSSDRAVAGEVGDGVEVVFAVALAAG